MLSKTYKANILKNNYRNEFNFLLIFTYICIHISQHKILNNGFNSLIYNFHLNFALPTMCRTVLSLVFFLLV